MSSDIGAIAVGRWHSTQLLNRIGATSLENVGAPAANAGDVHAIIIAVSFCHMVNDIMQSWLAADPSIGDAIANALPVDMIEAVDVSNAIVWLVSDDARYITGVTLPVDAGFTVKK